MKCKVCGKWFIPKKENKYIASETPTLISALSEVQRIYECFDCPRCGCQLVGGIKMRSIILKEKEDTDNG